MIVHRQRAPEGAQGIARKWRCAASSKSEPARVRCGWALGTGAHPAVEEKLDELARRGRAGAVQEARAEERAFLLAEADIAAAIGQHVGLVVAGIASPRREDGPVAVRLRSASAKITVTISPTMWTLAGAAQIAAALAELAPSWTTVRLDERQGSVELRARRTMRQPPAWRQTVERAWRERLARAS